MEDIHSNPLYFRENSPASFVSIRPRIHPTSRQQSISAMMGSTDFFNQEEINEGITAEEEEILQRLQNKKQKIESRRASMIQSSSSIKKSYPVFQDPQSYQEQKDNDPINLTLIRLLPRFQSLPSESSKLSQSLVQPNSRSSPLLIPTNPIQAHQDDAINALTAQVTSLAKII